MTNKEAVKYLIAPIVTSTRPSAEYAEYSKQKEAYELAIKSLEERSQGKWIIKPKENSQSAILICNKCGHFIQITSDKNFCPNCGADMRGT